MKLKRDSKNQERRKWQGFRRKEHLVCYTAAWFSLKSSTEKEEIGSHWTWEFHFMKMMRRWRDDSTFHIQWNGNEKVGERDKLFWVTSRYHTNSIKCCISCYTSLWLKTFYHVYLSISFAIFFLALSFHFASRSCDHSSHDGPAESCNRSYTHRHTQSEGRKEFLSGKSIYTFSFYSILQDNLILIFFLVRILIPFSII